MDVMERLNEIGKLVVKNDFKRAMAEIWNLWEGVPEPKTCVPNAYLIIEYGVACALKLQDLDAAETWAKLAPAFSAARHESGEVEFLVGKVAYERGELEKAKDWLRRADAKSEGRMFHGEDRKYIQLLGSGITVTGATSP